MDHGAAWRWIVALSTRVGAGEDPGIPSPLHRRGLDAEAATLVDLYLPIAGRADVVVAQVGQSLDGRVATSTGHSHYVTGPEDRLRLHRLRALVDAVVVGAGTAVSDRPRLTARRAEGTSPARVVLDPNGRVPPNGPLFEDGAAPTLWIRRGPSPVPLAPHVSVVEPPPADPGADVDPHALVALLRQRGYRRILVEGGGATVSGFVQAGALDRLHVTVAPLVIGSGRHGLTLPAIDRLDAALRPPARHFVLGADVLFDLDLGARAASRPPSPRGRDRSPPNARR